jgi:hypothetical protein
MVQVLAALAIEKRCDFSVGSGFSMQREAGGSFAHFDGPMLVTARFSARLLEVSSSSMKKSVAKASTSSIGLPTFIVN